MVFLTRPPGPVSSHNGHRHHRRYFVSTWAHHHALGNQEQEREQQRHQHRLQQMATARSQQYLHKRPHFHAADGGGDGSGATRCCLRRNGDIHETSHGDLQICVDSPGVKTEDIDITVHDNIMRIRGSRRHGIVVHHNDHHNHSSSMRTSHQYSSFCRTFAMDSKRMDLDSIKANLANGVLIVAVNKRVNTRAESSTNQKDHTDSDNQVALARQVDTHYHKIVIQRGSYGDQQREGCGMCLHLDVPGIKSDDLSVEIDSQKCAILIQGQRTIHPPLQVHKRYVLDQHRIDLSTVQAFLQDGVLTLMAPSLLSVAASKLMPRKIVVTDHPHEDYDRAEENQGCTSFRSEDKQHLRGDSTLDLTTSSDDDSKDHTNDGDQANDTKMKSSTSSGTTR
mmetsp:Transcript_13137/g.20480  ORF Transcript_13137/g.20480 Transcript_13137/m.20480 type:complete len:394 (-) Transcript_13137:1251-2432(-)